MYNPPLDTPGLITTLLPVEKPGKNVEKPQKPCGNSGESMG